MPKTALPITGGFYESASIPLSGQNCVNWYVNFPQTSTVTDGNLFGTPGLNQLATVSNVDTTRGAHEMDGKAFFVIGNILYRLNRTFDADGNDVFDTDSLGTIPGSGRVWMADNGVQLAINVPGGNSYIFTESPDTLTQITDADFDGPANSVVFVDGYFSFTKEDSRKVFNSNLLDGLNYNALDFNNVNTDAGNTVGQIVYQGQLYVMGSKKTQKFRNIGRDPAPFAQAPGAVWDKGLSAPFSLIETPSSFVMVGSGRNESPSVWIFNGNNFQKISSTAIDDVLAKLTDTQVASIYAWTYAEAGEFFVGFQLPDTCFVYGFTAQRWHERKSLDVNGNDIAYRVASMVTAYGRVIVGDTEDGRIGEIDRTLYKEYGGFIKRQCTTRPFDNLGENISVASIEAVMASGAGIVDDTITGVGGTILYLDRETQIRMSFSDDQGRTFSDELRRGLGKVGEYEKRAAWRRMGDTNRSRTLRFHFSDPADPTFIKLEADIS